MSVACMACTRTVRVRVSQRGQVFRIAKHRGFGDDAREVCPDSGLTLSRGEVES